MRVIYKEPGKEPRTMIIPNTLKMLQDLVGGYIETAPFNDNGIIVICNEEGRLRGLAPNFFGIKAGSLFVGPCVLVRDNGGEEFESLTDADVKMLMIGLGGATNEE